MTYNIRYANNNIGEEWDLRKDNVAEMIRFHKPNIFGLQEALFEQVEFISGEFDDFNMIGVGRDDGIKEGEFSPLFISKKFEIKDSGTFWLSETPDTPSLGWDASYKRIATWAKVQNLISNDSLFIINTHFDHKGELARIESAKLILKKISECSNNLQIILMGDFNFTDSNDAYNNLNNSELIQDSNEKSQNHYGTNNTFNGFEKEIIIPAKIDYIFVSDGIKVIHHAIIGDKFNNKYPSDHMPVIIDIRIQE
jgi:endonuclease/exonuclease/phosphatase family metal-dependent hydrolase